MSNIYGTQNCLSSNGCHTMLKLFIILCFNLEMVLTIEDVKILELKHCRDPKPPYASHKKAEENIALVRRNNRTYFTGNVTYETCSDCRWSLDVLRQYKGHRQRILRMKDVDSKHALVQAALRAIGIPTDSNTLRILPGSYVLPDIEVNDLQNIFRIPIKSSGVYVYVVEYNYHSPNKTHSCWISKCTYKVT